jgi:hypothetical protein
MFGMLEALGAWSLPQAVSVDDAAMRTSNVDFFMAITSN